MARRQRPRRVRAALLTAWRSSFDPEHPNRSSNVLSPVSALLCCRTVVPDQSGRLYLGERRDVSIRSRDADKNGGLPPDDPRADELGPQRARYKRKLGASARFHSHLRVHRARNRLTHEGSRLRRLLVPLESQLGSSATRHSDDVGEAGPVGRQRDR